VCGSHCLAGISSGSHKLAIDVGLLNRTMVLENDVVFGTVNANRRYYEAVADALAKADPEWLGRPSRGACRSSAGWRRSSAGPTT
jgi:glucose 1-dehydrogenase